MNVEPQLRVKMATGCHTEFGRVRRYRAPARPLPGGE